MKQYTITIIAIITLVILTAAPFVGTTKISISAVKDISCISTDAKILYQIRLPRVIAAFAAGAALACCGAALQAMFRNPLATPFTLGISGGAAFGAAIYIIFAYKITASFAGTTTSAFAGAIAAVGLVYGLTKTKKGFSVATMLLAGVAVNFFFSSLILLLQYLSDFTQSSRIIHWLMGSLSITGFGKPVGLLGIAVAGAVCIILQAGKLDLMSISDEIAMARGVDIARTRKIIFATTSVMVAAVVALCGPIGFVGLIIPHICRLMVSNRNVKLITASALFGGVFLVICDIIARIIVIPAEVPVGIITALLGCPFFIWLLLKEK